MSYDLPYIPLDLQRQILLLMPAEAVLRFRSVCKEWCSIIDDPSFVKTHTNNQCSTDADTLLIRSHGDRFLFSFYWTSLKFDHDLRAIDKLPIRSVRHPAFSHAMPIASCNGLMLFTFWPTKWAIWNPLTQDTLEVFLPRWDLWFVGIGLGYDSAADDYKIVRIVRLDTHEGVDVGKTLVYSLKSSRWSIMKANCPCSFKSSDVGFFLNGSLHWVSQARIIALDLGVEEYRLLPRPGHGDSTSTAIPPEDHMHLNAMGGYLALTYYYDDDQRLVVWVMKDYYGVEKAWTKLYSLGEHPRMLGQIWMPSSINPIFYWERKKHLLLQDEDGFIWLDIMTNNASAKKVIIKLGLFGNSPFSCEPWINSLFRPGQSVRGTSTKLRGGR